MFCDAQRSTPPKMDRDEQYMTPPLRPHLSITQLPTRIPKKAPA
jgi:hypothetical protein